MSPTRQSYMLWLLVMVMIMLVVVGVRGHDHGTKAPNSSPGGMGGMGGGMMNDDEHDDDDGETTMDPNKVKALVMVHAAIVTVVAVFTMPLAIGMVAGRRPDPHKIISGVNWLLLLFAGLIAMVGFADGDSGHAMMGITCLILWSAQAMYGLVRHFFYRNVLSITPHRTFGIIVGAFTYMTWFSGFAHVQGSCTMPEDVPMCEAHIYLGAFFVFVGMLHVYYSIEQASKWEMILIGFGGLSELVGEGLGDLVLNSIDPVKWPWNAHAKQLHLSAAGLWLTSAVVAYVVQWRWPSTSTKGLALIVGTIFHLGFMFTHGQDDAIIQASHMAHAFMLIPVVLLRPYPKAQMIVGMCLVLSGFFFASAADPIVRDAHYTSPGAYVMTVFMFAFMVWAVHCFIVIKIITRPGKEAFVDTIWERSGIYGCWQRFLCCFPCLRISIKNEVYEPIHHGIEVVDTKGVVQGDDDDDESLVKEDVSSEPTSSNSSTRHTMNGKNNDTNTNNKQRVHEV